MSSYDQKINKFFYFWLLSSLLMIILMVMIGGLTRLTNSGLSITKWELIKGILPPLNLEQWNLYFDYYKQIPQFKLINNSITLPEFKIIFYWEYIHRLLGRVIGLFFLLPLIYFYLKKKINPRYLSVCYLIMFLIIFQGIIGWYMVKSGLVNNTTVSHYRLSLHLFVAFIIISLLFWNILNVKNNTIKNFFKKDNSYFSITLYILIFLIYSQIILGAFVSGLDAGKLYQTWPLMNYSYFPDDAQIKSILDFLDFKNLSLIQFYHRNLAYIIVLIILLMGYLIITKKMFHIAKHFYLVLFFLFLQVFLGVITLTSGLNIYLASGHQICSLLLVISVLNLHYNYIN